MLPVMATTTPKVPLTIYLAPGLHDQLRGQAEQEQRSLSNLVAVFIDRGLNPMTVEASAPPSIGDKVFKGPDPK